MGNLVIVSVMKSLHDIFSIVWIGSLFFLSFIIIPVVKRKFDKKDEMKVMNNIFDRLSFFIFVAIIFLIITGILEHRFAKFSLLKVGKKISSTYVLVHNIKYVLTGIMVVIVVTRQIMRQKMKKRLAILMGSSEKSIDSKRPETSSMTPKMARPYLLIYINTFIGIIVVILSGVLAAVR